jgi:hypothetical protein
MGVDVEAVFDEGVVLSRPLARLFESLDRFVLELPHGDERLEM